MDSKTIFTKTAKGLGEAVGKTRALSRGLRKVLKEVDGEATFEELQARLDDMPDEKLQQAFGALLAEDYIREFISESSPPREEGIDFTTIAAFPETLAQLTIGAYLRAVEEAPTDSSVPAIDADASTGPQEDAAQVATLTQKMSRGETVARTDKAAIEKEALVQAEARRQAEESARYRAEEQARREAEEKSRRDVQEQARKAEEARRAAEVMFRKIAEEKAAREAEKARREAEQRAKEEAEARAREEEQERARQKAEEAARRQAEEAAQQGARAQARKVAEEQLRIEAEARARREAEKKAREEAEALAREEARVKKAAEEKARHEAEAREREEAAARMLRAAEERARQAAEIRSRREAENQARKQAQQQARREAEEKARQEAEEKARLEAEEQTRKEAEEKARREAEEKARREAEAQAGVEAEERTRKEAEENARREVEAKERQQAELRAREEAETEARRQAEAQARVEKEAQATRLREELAVAIREAEARAAREAELKAQQEEAERLRLESEAQAQRDAEARAREEAEERARLEAEARLREEAEELARREEATRAQERKEREEQAQREREVQAQREAEERKEAEERARREAEERILQQAREKVQREAEALAKKQAKVEARHAAEARSQQEAEERARRKAEQRDLREAEKLARREARERQRQETEQRALDEITEEAMPDAEISVEDEPAAPVAKALPKADKTYRKARPWEVSLGLALPVLLVFGLILIHLVSFDSRAANLEKAATAKLGQPVNIGHLYLSLLPNPHWRLEDVTIGNERQITAREISAVTGWSGLFGSAADFQSIAIDSPVVNEEGLGWLLFGKPKAGLTGIVRVTASNAKLNSPRIGFGMFDANVEMDAAGMWKTMVIDMRETQTHIELQPKADAVGIELISDAFALPFGSTLVLEKFHAIGVATRNELNVTEFQSSLDGGTLAGSAGLKWDAGWNLTGELNATGIGMNQIAPQLFDGGVVQGHAKFRLQSQEGSQLFAQPRLDGNFMVENGALEQIDLLTLFKDAKNGGRSAFNRLTGNFSHENGRTHLGNMRVAAGIVSAEGSTDIDASGNLSGRFAVDLNTPETQARAGLALSGTLTQPRFSRY